MSRLLLKLWSLMALSVLLGCSAQQPDSVKPANSISTLLWQSDLGNGQYINPILHLDYSDPDVVAVEGDYYMTSSSFNASPGLPILHSTDLVNWQLINYALPKQVPEQVFNTPQHGNGVWAPNIRFHDDKYWIFYPDPDFGIYLVTADNPAEKWSEPKLILPGKGLIDPTPMWDNDGHAYLLHGWAKSRAGFNNVLSLREMSSDGSEVSEQYTNVIDGANYEGYRTLEGPKFYKRNGYYYVFAPAGGVEQGWQSVFRSKQITGPYEARIVMEQGDTLINGPHQGSWIQTEFGQDWFIHFQSRKAYGRIVHLQPMQWVNDWPVIGEDTDNDGIGQPVYKWTKPLTNQAGEVKAQPVSDEFNNPELGLQWQWNANFQQHWYQLDQQRGALRLIAQQQVNTTGDNLWMTPSLLVQKIPAQTFEVRSQLNLNNTDKDVQGGLLMFGEDYAWVGIKPYADGHHLVYVQCRGARLGCDESVEDYGLINADTLELRMIMHDDATVLFSYRTDTDQRFTVVGDLFNAVRGRWVGAKIGLFSVTENPASVGQSALEVDYFRGLPMRRTYQ